MVPREEGAALASTLDRLAGIWDGQEVVGELRRDGSPNWRQMEWIGFYFEWAGLRLLSDVHGGGPGPEFGHSSIDYQLTYPWDLKVHPRKNSARSWAALNDVEAVESAVTDHGSCGFLIGVGTAVMDVDGSFYAWHEAYKGDRSHYTRERIQRGAPSRIRKSAFELETVVGFALTSEADIVRAVGEGWLDPSFQTGMRNSDGSPRRAKYKVDVHGIATWARVC